MNVRQKLLRQIGEKIISLPKKFVTKVAIDGVDGAGKTFFANELAEVMRELGIPVIRAGVDGFHNCREVRYRKGKNSAEGFFEDSYNYKDLVKYLLEPLSGESLPFRRKIFDHRIDSEVKGEFEIAVVRSVLIFDGIFLHRDEIKKYWDFSIFLDVNFEVSIPRGAQRGEGSADLNAESNQRYINGQKLYLMKCNHQIDANIIIDNNDFKNPFMVRNK